MKDVNNSFIKCLSTTAAVADRKKKRRKQNYIHIQAARPAIDKKKTIRKNTLNLINDMTDTKLNCIQINRMKEKKKQINKMESETK